MERRWPVGVVGAAVRILQVLSVVKIHGECTSAYPMERRWFVGVVDAAGVVGAAIRMILQVLLVVMMSAQ